MFVVRCWRYKLIMSAKCSLVYRTYMCTDRGLPCRHMLAASAGMIAETDVPLRYHPDFMAGKYDYLLPRTRDDLHIGLFIGKIRVSTSEVPWEPPVLASSASVPTMAPVPHASAGQSTAGVAAAAGAPAGAPAGTPTDVQSTLATLLENTRATALDVSRAWVATAPAGNVVSPLFAECLANRVRRDMAAVLEAVRQQACSATQQRQFETLLALGKTITAKVFSCSDRTFAKNWVEAINGAAPHFHPPKMLTYGSVYKALAQCICDCPLDTVDQLAEQFNEFNDNLPRSYPGDNRQRRQRHAAAARHCN